MQAFNAGWNIVKSSMNHDQILQATQQWLEHVVIGLNLCPFAAKPNRLKQIRTVICDASEEAKDFEEAILTCLEHELKYLDAHQAEQVETTLIVIPNALFKFDDYNQFLDYAEFLLKRGGWEGTYQIASFHPDYCFADAHPDDDENLTNRSPYPVMHLIREASLEEAIRKYPDTEDIPNRNIELMENLTDKEKAKLFPYLF